jgi:hypothetical protein
MLDQFFIVYTRDREKIHFAYIGDTSYTICGHKTTPSRWEAEVDISLIELIESKGKICKKCLKVLDKAGLI